MPDLTKRHSQDTLPLDVTFAIPHSLALHSSAVSAFYTALRFQDLTL